MNISKRETNLDTKQLSQILETLKLHGTGCLIDRNVIIIIVLLSLCLAPSNFWAEEECHTKRIEAKNAKQKIT